MAMLCSATKAQLRELPRRQRPTNVVRLDLLDRHEALEILQALLKEARSVDAVNDAFRRAAAEGPLKGIMAVLEDEWASSRIVGDPHSSLIDLPLTIVQGSDFVNVAVWYDNEYGFTSRLAEMAAFMAR